MSVIYIVLPLAVVFAAIALWACIWAIRSGQFEDTSTPALRVLLDDSDPAKGSSVRSHRSGNVQDSKSAKSPDTTRTPRTDTIG